MKKKKQKKVCAHLYQIQQWLLRQLGTDILAYGNHSPAMICLSDPRQTKASQYELPNANSNFYWMRHMYDIDC